MKFLEPENINIFTTFLEDEDVRYLRFNIYDHALWYAGSKTGFELVLDNIKHNELERLYYDEQEQQASKQEGTSNTVHPASSEGPEGAKQN